MAYGIREGVPPSHLKGFAAIDRVRVRDATGREARERVERRTALRKFRKVVLVQEREFRGVESTGTSTLYRIGHTYHCTVHAYSRAPDWMWMNHWEVKGRERALERLRKTVEAIDRVQKGEAKWHEVSSIWASSTCRRVQAASEVRPVLRSRRQPTRLP